MFLDSKGVSIRTAALALALALAGCGGDEGVSSATDEAGGQVPASVEAGPGDGGDLGETEERVKRDAANAFDAGAAVETEWSDSGEPIQGSIDGP
ncbi:MAG: hypothetical protein JRG86_09245 [Deltaproteobacteria bacterium]|jgi:ABC-type glycerol-3-phosphate transport system substrate-binding protein|nr:hypothetical protein [Deltaproteobacteria bacterium]MBW2500236.1 hypothetical protein [Deltaproteobacteria bacterium]